MCVRVCERALFIITLGYLGTAIWSTEFVRAVIWASVWGGREIPNEFEVFGAAKIKQNLDEGKRKLEKCRKLNIFSKSETENQSYAMFNCVEFFAFSVCNCNQRVSRGF